MAGPEPRGSARYAVGPRELHRASGPMQIQYGPWRLLRFSESYNTYQFQAHLTFSPECNLIT